MGLTCVLPTLPERRTSGYVALFSTVFPLNARDSISTRTGIESNRRPATSQPVSYHDRRDTISRHPLPTNWVFLQADIVVHVSKCALIVLRVLKWTPRIRVDRDQVQTRSELAFKRFQAPTRSTWQTLPLGRHFRGRF